MLSLAFDGNAPREQIDGFVAGCLDRPLVEQTVITCVATLRKNEDDDFSESVIVIGTENAKLHIVEAAKAFQTYQLAYEVLRAAEERREWKG